MSNRTRFAGYPAAVAYHEPGGKARDRAQHLLWGDWIGLTGREQGSWLQAHVRGVERRGGRARPVWLHRDGCTDERILEVNFVDIGQGDGCLIVTPDDRKIVIDAGKRDHMFRFLRWRFGKFLKETAFESFVISHPDLDHYGGFRPLLDHKKVRVLSLIHI